MSNLSLFFKNYTSKLNKAILNIDMSQLKMASNTLKTAIKKGNTIYVCGNGGSAAIANHYVCDFFKIF